MDKRRHLLYMQRILRDIYLDPFLSEELKFKGGTAAMMFHGLPRFSTDLDFNLEHSSKQHEVFVRLSEIVRRYGNIDDAADKNYGPIVVLDYGPGERKLKLEASNRLFDNHYDRIDFGSLSIPVLKNGDMLSHKLCAMKERRAPRDVFDVWYFLSKGWPLNGNIIRERTGESVSGFLSECKSSLEEVSPASVMQEIGELLDERQKQFVRSRLLADVNDFLSEYIANPIMQNEKPTLHTSLLFEKEGLLPLLTENSIEPSTLSNEKLLDIISGRNVAVKNKQGSEISIEIVDGRTEISRSKGK